MQTGNVAGHDRYLNRRQYTYIDAETSPLVPFV